MQTARRARLWSVIAGLALIAGLIAAPGINAQEEGSQYDWAPDDPFIDGGPIPPEAFEELANCPDPVELDLIFCLKAKVYEGDLKIGSNRASVDPMELTLGLGLDDEGEPVIVDGAGGGGGLGSVAISGGILGMPELDPLINADPLDLLSLDVTPRMGDIGIVGGGFQFISWLGGQDTDVTLKVPLSLRLDNLLLGMTCQIDEFDINLTTGMTSPPEGVEPISGSHGPYSLSTWWKNGYPPDDIFDVGPRFQIEIREGSTLVDNAFAVDGAHDCGPLGLGKALNDADLGGLNIVDDTVNDIAGLPATAGRNHASFKVDTLLVLYTSGLGIGPGSWFDEGLNAGS